MFEDLRSDTAPTPLKIARFDTISPSHVSISDLYESQVLSASQIRMGEEVLVPRAHLGGVRAEKLFYRHLPNFHGYKAEPFWLYVLPKTRVFGLAGLTLLEDGSLYRPGAPKPLFDAQGNPIVTHPYFRDLTDQTVELDGLNYSTLSAYRDNYYHWHMNILPTLFAARQAGFLKNLRVITGSLKPWQSASLHRLGLTANQFYKHQPKIGYSGRFLRSSSQHHPGFKKHPFVADLMSALAGSKPTASHRFLYLARFDAPARRIRNETNLAKAFQKIGFEVVSSSGMNYEDQIALFQSTKFLVSAHGAGLTNIGFMQPGSIVLELFPRSYINHAYHTLAAVSGIRYAAFISELAEGKGPRMEWEISPDDATSFAQTMIDKAI